MIHFGAYSTLLFGDVVAQHEEMKFFIQEI